MKCYKIQLDKNHKVSTITSCSRWILKQKPEHSLHQTRFCVYLQIICVVVCSTLKCRWQTHSMIQGVGVTALVLRQNTGVSPPNSHHRVVTQHPSPAVPHSAVHGGLMEGIT